MTYTSQYHSWLPQIQKNEKQLEAFQRSGHTVVIAGPGSGKTRILAIKIAQLLREEIAPPRGVACLTYTRTMAKELETRLAALGVIDRTNVVVGTVHSFCLGQVVHPFSEIFDLGLPQPIRIAPVHVWNSCLDQARRKITGLAYDPEKDGRFRIEMTKYHLLKVDTPFEKWGHQQFAKIIQTHYQLLCEQGYVDFNLIVKSALSLVAKHDLVRESLYAKFAWLAVDEYQDLGYPLFRIVTEMIDHTNIRLFAIGDPNQSIFDFAGTDPKYLIALTNRPEMKPVVKLARNYRAKAEVITISKAILPPYCDYQSEEQGGACHVYETLPHEQSKKVAELAQKYLASGIRPRRIAILHPWRENGLHSIANDLQASSIEFALDKSPYYDRSMNLIKWLEDLGSWCLEGWKLENDPTDSKSFDDLVIGFTHMLHPLATGYEIDSEERLRLTKFVWSIQGQDMLFSDWLSYATTQLGFDQGLEEYKKIYPDEVEELANLQDTLRSGNKLERMRLSEFVNITRGIQLTTLHSSKGMEFEVVIIAGVERIWNNENGRRLLYVGVTRAENEVCLLYSKIWPEVSPRIPQYIQGLLNKCSHLDYFHHHPLTTSR